MKKLFGALLLLVITGGVAIDCPPTEVVDPNSIDFAYEPNQVNYKLMCIVTVEAGEEVVKTVTACDPDGDRMSFDLLNGPEGMLLLPGSEADEGELTWIAVEGLYYVDVCVIDHPPLGDNALEDRASMIFKVYPKNRAPVFGGCR